MFKLIGKIFLSIIFFLIGIFLSAYTYPAGIDSSCLIGIITEMSYEEMKKESFNLGVINKNEPANRFSFNEINEDICWNKFLEDFEKEENKYRPLFIEKIKGYMEQCHV